MAEVTEVKPVEKPKRPKFEPPILDDETRQRLEEEHEDILVLQGTEMAPWIAAVRRPTRQEVIAFKQHAKRDSTTANEVLIRAITVFPDKPTMDRQISKWALLVDGIATNQRFTDFVGLTTNDSVK